jgi:hypothetical protein
MKTFFRILLCLFCFSPFTTHADTVVRNSIFSTSTDWESVTGMYLSQFQLNFLSDKQLVGNGLELYFLDGFPCFAQTDSSRIWIGQNNKTDNKIRLTCLFAPKTVYFAWRNAKRDATQDKTTGILECPVSLDGDLKIDLSKCIMGKKWEEYR